ncbi:MAG: helix-turn-helix domain-containing protein [Candidatus Omnitrophica bacterium]|nr:helix-turn-helix domain-containing protein [Candidatus Omnitrophota bacterium]
MSSAAKIGKRIKKLRKIQGLSQDKLSKLADVTHTTLAKIEVGKNDNPTIKTLLKIAKVLNVKVNELVY